MEQAGKAVPLGFAGAELIARADGALWWPAERALVVADLHLGKAERIARRGGALLPPGAEAETLARLGAALDATGAARVVVLGDGFDDAEAAGALGAAVKAELARLAAGRDWLWVEGNHDAGLAPAALGLPGAAVAELRLGGLRMRHEAGAEHDISGHWHPAVRVAGRRRAAFLVGARHLILPAFGRYTGGLDAGHPALAALVPSGLAVLTGARAVAVPWPLPAAR
jgi:DNA ligase-associated metallophosphoesterase